MLADSSGLLLLFLKHAVSSTHCFGVRRTPGRCSLTAHQDGDKREAFTGKARAQHALCCTLVQSPSGQSVAEGVCREHVATSKML